MHVVQETWRRVLATWRRLLPEKWHAITEEFAKFGTIGVVNLFVNFAVFNLLWLTVLRTGEVKAKAIATMVAVTCAYFMNRHWTYRDRPKSTLRREYSLFFFFNLVGLVIEVAVMFIAKYGFHQTHILVLNLCTGLGIVLGTAFRFWAYRTHVFKLDLAVAGDSPAFADESGEVAVATGAPDRVNGSRAVNGRSVSAGAERVNGHATPAAADRVNGHAVVRGADALADGSRHGARRRRPRQGAAPAAPAEKPAQPHR